MNMKIPTPVAIVLVIVVAVVVVYFGYQKVTGGPDADVTKQVISHYKPKPTTAPVGGDSSGGMKNSGSGSISTPAGETASGAKSYH
jgi:uncharacterized membrane protein YphA (DoxX/SURF4 family)